MWYNIDSTNAMLVCRRKGGQNVTDRQDYRFILQIEPGRYASRGKREHTEPKDDFTKANNLFAMAKDLHNAYYVSLIEQLSIVGKILDADGD